MRSPYDWHLVEEYQFKGTNKRLSARRQCDAVPTASASQAQSWAMIAG